MKIKVHMNHRGDPALGIVSDATPEEMESFRDFRGFPIIAVDEDTEVEILCPEA